MRGFIAAALATFRELWLAFDLHLRWVEIAATAVVDALLLIVIVC